MSRSGVSSRAWIPVTSESWPNRARKNGLPAPNTRSSSTGIVRAWKSARPVATTVDSSGGDVSTSSSAGSSVSADVEPSRVDDDAHRRPPRLAGFGVGIDAQRVVIEAPSRRLDRCRRAAGRSGEKKPAGGRRRDDGLDRFDHSVDVTSGEDRPLVASGVQPQRAREWRNERADRQLPRATRPRRPCACARRWRPDRPPPVR